MNWIGFCLMFVYVLGGGSLLRAFEVSPAVHTFEAGKQMQPQFFQVENPASTPLVLEVAPRLVSYTFDGREKLTPATNIFQVFPSKLVVPPNGRQRVRISVLDPKSIAEDRLYRVVFKDLPVTIGPGGTNSGMKLTTEYHQLVTVRGAKTKASVVLESAGPAQGTNAELKGKMEVVVRNQGNGFARLSGLKGRLAYGDGSGSGTFRVDATLVTNLNKLLLLPGDRRRLLFPLAEGQSAPAEVEVEL